MFLEQDRPRARSDKAATAASGNWKYAYKKLATNMPNRRLNGWARRLLGRLPLLGLWVCIVILVLYMLFSSSNHTHLNHNPGDHDDQPAQAAIKTTLEQQDATSPTPLSQLLIASPDDATQQRDINLARSQRPATRGQQAVPTRAGVSSQKPVSTTRKSPTSEFSRQSEIFILIIQDQDERSKFRSGIVRAHLHPGSSSLPSMPANDASQSSPTDDGLVDGKRRRKLIIPAHIRLLTEILDYHRIGYTIDTSRHGLPEQLLLEGLNQRHRNNRRRYSVLVVDDFIKYTKLNRWIRDQLDRYCASNGIGVISYLLDNHKLDHHVFHHHPDDDSATRESTPPINERGTAQANGTTSTTRVTTSEGFPLTFEPIKQDCQNASSTSCLVDYQLSDQTQILRILKNKANFVLRGALDVNAGNSPLVTMASNHITYEPLTWARLREPASAALVRGRRFSGAERSPPPAGLDGGGDKLTNVSESLGRQRRSDDEPRLALTNIVTRHTDRRAARHLAPALRKRRHAVAAAAAAAIAALASPAEVTPEWSAGGGGGADLVDANGPVGETVDGQAEDYAQQPDVSSAGSSASLSSLGDAGDDQSSAEAESSTSSGGGGDGRDPALRRRVLSMIDHGLYDGIRRILFGVTNQHWLNRALVLDAVEYLSSGEIMTPLERYIQIDIDDIFVGETGTRMHADDVEALIETQRKFANEHFEPSDQFKFNLGFSGKFFKRGNPLEQQGDQRLIERANEFTWFCHFWSHAKAHLMNDSESLANELRRNLLFAHDNNLTLIGHSSPPPPPTLPGSLEAMPNAGPQHLPATYAVAPHHSGVYPIHRELYETWRRILNVQVTSTEEYPHLRPASGRRGFVFDNIKVLPRQVCGLYTHTIFKRKYPGGFARLVANIRGGELFETVLHNPVNIYMSHMSNYANDRLAPYTFDELFKFVREHTNLRLRYAPSALDRDDDDLSAAVRSDDEQLPTDVSSSTVGQGSASGLSSLGPLKLASYYFDLWPSEREPLWTNPCQDRRHLAIWAPQKHQMCRQVPRLLIVGPQKTGTTALHAFLQLNPTFKTSSSSPDDFEEIQFFNDKHYFKGSDWYLSRFPAAASNSSHSPVVDSGGATGSGQSSATLVYLDKSATYFDDPKVARRAAALLPNASVVILLINPADRAYSWYQHMRAHGDPAASRLSFEDILSYQEATTTSTATISARVRARSRSRKRRNGTNSTLHSNPDEPKPSQIVALRRRCLHPGYYSSHLFNWLEHFDSRQIVIIDGEWFRYNPAAVLNRLQLLLRVHEPVDYSSLLVYSEQKGFYCERSAETAPSGRRRATIKCLGSGKGRKYEPMSQAARLWLNSHYSSHNKQLAKLLYEIGQPLPTWLDQTINQLPSIRTI